MACPLDDLRDMDLKRLIKKLKLDDDNFDEWFKDLGLLHRDSKCPYGDHEMNFSKGLCNCTRIMVTELKDNAIREKIITEGAHYGREVSIPRITINSSKSFGFTLSRHQFPIKPAFAMTIHKSQGQTFECVSVDLIREVFSHGQLYVAFSGVRRRAALKVLLDVDCQNRTKNIADHSILQEGAAKEMTSREDQSQGMEPMEEDEPADFRMPQ